MQHNNANLSLNLPVEWMNWMLAVMGKLRLSYCSWLVRQALGTIDSTEKILLRTLSSSPEKFRSRELASRLPKSCRADGLNRTNMLSIRNMVRLNMVLSLSSILLSYSYTPEPTSSSCYRMDKMLVMAWLSRFYMVDWINTSW